MLNNVINYNNFNNLLTFKSKKNNTIHNAVLTSRKFEQNGFPYEKDKLVDFVKGELKEFDSAVKNNDADNMEEELGDILFDTIMLADAYKINPEKALIRTTNKINDRFNMIDLITTKPLIEYSQQERANFWKCAKERLKNE